MTAFSRTNRGEPLMHTVAFHQVPMFRGIALAIDHIESHGASVSIASADRRDDVITRFNREHHTNLHGQQALIDLHAKNPARYAAANPPDETSHCLRADPTISRLLATHGTRVAVRGQLPWWALGIDLDDRGKVEDCTYFLHVARDLGYAFKQPYTAGSERHHVILVESPVAALERWNVIPRGDHR